MSLASAPILVRPPDARALYVLAHGAGAGMRHRFLQEMADALAAQAIATFRFEFPYATAGRKRPDPPALLEATVRGAVAAAQEAARGLPILAGGKSMGGRMTTQAEARDPIDGVRGVVLLGFPLHAAGAPSSARGEHLVRVGVPALFLQGTRDKLADLALLRPLLPPSAELRVIDGADHGFHVPKSSGKSDADVVRELAAEIAAFAARIGGGG
jgi:hypothetical protein